MKRTYKRLLMDTIYNDDDEALKEILIRAYNREYNFGKLSKANYEEYKDDMIFQYTLRLLQYRKDKKVTENNILVTCGVPRFAYMYNKNICNKKKRHKKSLSLEEIQDYHDCTYSFEDEVIDRVFGKEIAGMASNIISDKYIEKPIYTEIYSRKFGFGKYKDEKDFILKEVGKSVNRSTERVRQITNDIVEEIRKVLFYSADLKPDNIKNIEKLFLPKYTPKYTWEKSKYKAYIDKLDTNIKSDNTLNDEKLYNLSPGFR